MFDDENGLEDEFLRALLASSPSYVKPSDPEWSHPEHCKEIPCEICGNRGEHMRQTCCYITNDKWIMNLSVICDKNKSNTPGE